MNKFRVKETGHVFEADDRWAKVYRDRKDLEEIKDDVATEVAGESQEDGATGDDEPTDDAESVNDDGSQAAETTNSKRKKKS